MTQVRRARELGSTKFADRSLFWLDAVTNGGPVTDPDTDVVTGE